MRSPVLLLFVLGCPVDLDDLFPSTPTDSGDGGSDGGRDTGTAFVTWHGHVSFDPDEESLVASRGIAAFLTKEQDYVCDIAANFVSTGAGAPGCPDCAWSFTTRLTGGGTTGELCEAFLEPTLFDQVTYQDLYFAQQLDGFGWTDEFVYDYGMYVYDLEDVVWAHISGPSYNGWYLYGYNFKGSVTGVFGDRYDAEFRRYASGNNGQLLYYYFYY